MRCKSKTFENPPLKNPSAIYAAMSNIWFEKIIWGPSVILAVLKPMICYICKTPLCWSQQQIVLLLQKAQSWLQTATGKIGIFSQSENLQILQQREPIQSLAWAWGWDSMSQWLTTLPQVETTLSLDLGKTMGYGSTGYHWTSGWRAYSRYDSKHWFRHIHCLLTTVERRAVLKRHRPKKGPGQETGGGWPSENGDVSSLKKQPLGGRTSNLAPSSLLGPTCHSVRLTCEQTTLNEFTLSDKPRFSEHFLLHMSSYF